MKSEKLDIKYAENFSRNVITNVIQLAVNILIGLLLVPFFIDTLGPAAYALIPLATSLTTYVILFVDVINAAIARFLTIELQRGDVKKANETYSTSFTILIGFVIILTPVVLLISYFAPNIFETGSISSVEVSIFFALIMLSVLVSALKSNFMVVLFSYNRLDLRNIVTIVQTLGQVIIIVLLFNIFGPSLPSVGFAYLSAAVVSFILSYLLARKQTDVVSYSLSSFNKSRIRELAGLSFFILFDRLGCVMQSQIALIVVNIYFGAVLQAEYSLVITIGSFLVSLGGIVTSTVAPKVYSLAGLNDDIGVTRFVGMFTKITGLLIALPLALICIFSEQLLTIWVGPEYAHISSLVWLLIPVYYFTITLSCQSSIGISHNRMKIPALLNMVAGIVYLILALVFPTVFNNGYYGVALAYVVTIFTLHGIIGSMFYMYVLKGPLFTFIKKMWVGVFAMLILMLIGILYTRVIVVNSIGMLLLSGIIFTTIYLVVLLRFVLSTEEKNLAKSCLPKCVQNMKIVKWI